MNPASNMGWPQGFVVYDERDLKARQIIVDVFTDRLKSALTGLNRAVRFFQIETPMLTFKEALKGHEATGFELVKSSFAKHGQDEMYLRPETTFGTYAAFRAMWPMEPERKKQMPICLWQYGKSFRDEQARPMGELRFREFYQLEYQLFFSPDTKADYFGTCVNAAADAICGVTHTLPKAVPVPEDELAHYSAKTFDLYWWAYDTNEKTGEQFEIRHEVAAISERKDFEGAKVMEVSVGLDRLTALQQLLSGPKELLKVIR